MAKQMHWVKKILTKGLKGRIVNRRLAVKLIELFDNLVYEQAKMCQNSISRRGGAKHHRKPVYIGQKRRVPEIGRHFNWLTGYFKGRHQGWRAKSRCTYCILITFTKLWWFTQLSQRLFTLATHWHNCTSTVRTHRHCWTSASYNNKHSLQCVHTCAYP